MRSMYRKVKFLALALCAVLLFGACGAQAPEDKSPESAVKKDIGRISADRQTGAAGDGKKEPASDARSASEPASESEPEPEPELPEGSVTSLQLDRYSVSLTTGASEMPLVTMLPEDARDKSEIWESDDPAVATVDAYGNITGVGVGTCTVTVTSANNPRAGAEVRVEVRPHPGVTYIDGILIANKTYSLPADYNPGVNEAARAALEEMIGAAKDESISLWVVSGFRSYHTQAAIYSGYVARDGVAAADRYSARPGHSEHQTGLAFDLNSLEQYFGETPEGQWLAANCWKYGFIIRYPQEKEDVTGYMYEPWHVRYLGKEIAQKVYDSGLCLEEYLDITSAYEESE